MTQDSVLKGFLKAAKQNGIKEQDAVALYKSANIAKLLSGIGKLAPSQRVMDVATPLAGGTAGAVMAHNEGASPLVTAASGIGGAMISSPARYRQLWNTAKMQKDPVTSMGFGVLGDVGKKVAITAVPAVGEGVIGLARGAKDLGEGAENIKKTTGNLANITGQVSKGLEGTAPNINQAVKDVSAGASQAGKNVGAAAGDFSKMMAGLSGTSSNLQDASKSLNTGLPAAMNKLPEFMDATTKGMGDLTQAAQQGAQAGQGVSTALNRFADKADSISGIDWGNVARLGGKDWTRTGVAGGGILSALLLPKLIDAYRERQQPQKKKN
jgi:methyl-accepting chemotaxis protein